MKTYEFKDVGDGFTPVMLSDTVMSNLLVNVELDDSLFEIPE